MIIDIWSSGQKLAVIGITAQYMKEGQLVKLNLGFRHFPESHTGSNIQIKLTEFISEMGLQHSQVALSRLFICSFQLI